MCTVQSGELVPHRRTAENVYGAEWRISTAQRSFGRCVRYKKANKHRTEALQKIYTVQKDRKMKRQIISIIQNSERKKYK